MFVSATDFMDFPYKIPNQEETKGFDAYIESVEVKLLKQLLGLDLYNQMVDGLESITQADWNAAMPTVINTEYVYGNDIWKALTTQTGTAPVAGSDWQLIDENNIWLSLKNGSEYMIDGTTYEWQGMVKMLKPAIFSEWIRTNHRRLTASSVIVNNGQNNTTLQDPSFEIVIYWNEFVDIAGHCYSLCNTLYGFLVENEEDYEDLIWHSPQKINQMGI